MGSSYYYNGNQYIPSTIDDRTKGYLIASAVSGGILRTLPLFGKPFTKQLIQEHSQNHLYKDAFEKALEVSGLNKKGVSIIPAQFTLSADEYSQGLNAAYAPKLKTVKINTDKISIAGFHELGHAMNDLKGKTGKILSKMRWPGRSIAIYLGVLALFSRTKPKEAPDNWFDKIKNNCGKLAFACMLPTVFEEGMASYKGLKLARKTGLAEPLVKNMRKLYGKALLTYIGHATVTGLAVGAASMIMDSFGRPKKVNNESSFFL